MITRCTPKPNSDILLDDATQSQTSSRMHTTAHLLVPTSDVSSWSMTYIATLFGSDPAEGTI
eukprot:3171864-Amphidinium_carterae.1